MRKQILHILWLFAFLLCACLGFITERTQGIQALLSATALLFFAPPGILLIFALREQDSRELKRIRCLSALSLVLTVLALILAIVTAPTGDTLAGVCNSLLTIVSSPMYCTKNWAVSLFLWALLLIASLQKKQKT